MSFAVEPKMGNGMTGIDDDDDDDVGSDNDGDGDG